MIREVCKADCETPSGYRLRLTQIGPIWRAEAFAPLDGGRLHIAVNGSAEAALESVAIFFDGNGAHPVGVALREEALAEIAIDAQPDLPRPAS